LSHSTPQLSEREFRAAMARLGAAMKESDAIILRHFRKVRIQHKADGSEVTIADKGAERVLRRHLRAAWPRDPVLGEEYGGQLTRSGRCWLLDPIDGTASYVLGIPMFGTLISLLLDGEPVFGCIHLSALRETTYGATGFGCWLKRDGARPRRARVAPSPPLAEAKVGLSSFKNSDLFHSPGPIQLSACSMRWYVAAPSTRPSIH
jgi:histidinol-phosphatase